MRLNKIKVLCVGIAVLLMSGCGSANSNSKVDAVMQSQMEKSDNKSETTAVTTEMTTEKFTEPTTTEKVTEAYTEPVTTEMLTESTTETISTESDTEEKTTDVSSESSTTENGSASAAEGVDVDLSALSSTMVYSEVYNMMAYPEKYYGKIIRMKGSFTVLQNEQDESKLYFACFISDATACCAQGIEFLLTGEHKYPEDYPGINDPITVTGEFETYEEDGYTYCRLKNATMEK